MILAYTGTVGSGKSYHVLRHGLQHIGRRSNRLCIANFPIIKKKSNDDRWNYVEDITVPFLVETSIKNNLLGNEGSGLVIFDEAGTIFNSRDWNVKPDERKQWIKFFTQSRKFGYDVIFVVQDLRMLDRQIRSLCEFEVKHIKANYYSWFKWLPFTLFFYVSFWQGAKFRGALQADILFPWVANRYDSMKMFNFDHETNKLLEEYGLTGGDVSAGEGVATAGVPYPDDTPPAGTTGIRQVVSLFFNKIKEVIL